MNLRHAAALALAGWYLMAPPKAPASSWDQVVRWWNGDSLSQWEELGTYDSADKCEAARSKISAGKDADQLRLPRCIGTDDPRLKPN